MAKLSLGLSILALVLVGVLFFTQSSKNEKKDNKQKDEAVRRDTVIPFKMAYFEMDSVENNYEYVKEIRETLRRKEEDMNRKLEGKKNAYQKEITEWQKRGPNISQAQSEEMNRRYQQMQFEYEKTKQDLDESLKRDYQNMLMDVNKKISNYLKEYNKSKGYHYIITNEQSLIYYKDSVYDITNDVVKGLNDGYKATKKKN